MRIEIVRNAEAFFSLRNKWNNALDRSESDIFFLRHEWLTNWWRCHGDGHELFVVLVLEGDEIVAAAPLMILKEKLWGLIWIRKLQFIAHGVSDYMEFMICGDREKYFEIIIRQLKEHQDYWDWAEFIYLRDEQGFLDLWKGVESQEFAVLYEKRDISVIVEISGLENYDVYARHLDKKVRQDIVRNRNNISKLGRLSLEIYTSAYDICALIEEFFRLHKQKWGSQKIPSQFSNAIVRNSYSSLVKELDGTGYVELAVLKCGRDIIAMHYGFVYNGRYYWYTPTYNQYYQKYSPGKLLLADLIDRAISRKMLIFDLLRGDEQYKRRWSGKQVGLFGVVFLKNNALLKIFYSLFIQGKKKILTSDLGRRLAILKNRVKKAFVG